MSTTLHSSTDLTFIFGADEALASDGRVLLPVSSAATEQAGNSSQQAVPGILVLDTCILLSNVLRRVFLRLAAQGCFIPVWSERIGGEWRRNAARLWGVPMTDIEAQWMALQQAFPLADQGDVSSHEEGLRRSDPKDWHVIAAGRAAKSRFPGRTAAVVTRNTKDFNRSEMRGYGLALFEPDALLLRLQAAHPDAMRALLPDIPALATAPGQEPASLETILKRERLFRLNRLYRSLS